MFQLQRLRAPASSAATLRPARPDDASALGALIESLPRNDRFLRFHGAVNGLATDDLQRWTDVDPARAFAVVAAVGDAHGESLVADARFVIDANGDAEIGLVVSPAWRRRGLGARCLAALRVAAHRAGVRWLHGTVLADNRPMLALLKRCGFTIARARGQLGLMNVELRVA